MSVFLVALGGALGAASRYLLGGWIQGWMGPGFPWSTLVINVSGSLMIGFILGLVESGALSSHARLFLAVGVLGGYTTFSSFSYECIQMLERGNLSMLLLNSVGQVGLGLLAANFGVILARSLP